MSKPLNKKINSKKYSSSAASLDQLQVKYMRRRKSIGFWKL
jgi:hypothetical protein